MASFSWAFLWTLFCFLPPWAPLGVLIYVPVWWMVLASSSAALLCWWFSPSLMIIFMNHFNIKGEWSNFFWAEQNFRIILIFATDNSVLWTSNEINLAAYKSWHHRVNWRLCKRDLKYLSLGVESFNIKVCFVFLSSFDAITFSWKYTKRAYYKQLPVKCDFGTEQQKTIIAEIGSASSLPSQCKNHFWQST